MDGKLHRAGSAGIRNRHHDIDIVDGQLAFDFFRQRNAHIQTRLIDGYTVDDGVGTREIDVFKETRAEFDFIAALTRHD
ncbi:Uncharacterised protein [Mycobacteroides abscessus subsp. massiliense]|nr:Uncharacterised protein [Mycobacteroides abscessus subsp. massiliense]